MMDLYISPAGPLLVTMFAASNVLSKDERVDGLKFGYECVGTCRIVASLLPHAPMHGLGVLQARLGCRERPVKYLPVAI